MRLGVVLASALIAMGCHRPKHYEANVEVTRLASVRKDPSSGKPQTVDLEVSYVDCPGAQSEVIRGGADFAACVGKYKVGDKVHVAIDHEWDPEGHYTWTVRKIGDCERIPDPNDEASYAVVRECDDQLVNGVRVGFVCRYIPEKKLIDKCPWFRRR